MRKFCRLFLIETWCQLNKIVMRLRPAEDTELCRCFKLWYLLVIVTSTLASLLLVEAFFINVKPLESRGNYSANQITYVGTLAVDGWTVTFGTAMRGLGGPQPTQATPCCTKCNSPPINDQCTNLRITV